MRFIAFAVLSLASVAEAGDLRLDWPVDCTLGQDCHIQQYVDHDPGKGSRDFTCNGLSYDGHKGTDIALPSLRAMQAGVDVYAAASGVVIARRDGMADQYLTEKNRNSIKGRECGNAVTLRHDDGWQTQYCHLKRGSVAVRKGDKVRPGHILGKIGLSGSTQFPHLHVSVRHNEKVVDPFAPKTARACTQNKNAQLWRKPVEYEAGGLIAIGFAPEVPSYDAVKTGDAGRAPLTQSAEAIVTWVYAFGSRAGDQLRVRISGPGGAKVFENTQTLEKPQAQYFRAAGSRLPNGLPRGTYVTTAELFRKGRKMDQMTHQMQVR